MIMKIKEFRIRIAGERNFLSALKMKFFLEIACEKSQNTSWQMSII